jgi:transcriptional regulator with XRE-family HTH domain
MAGSEKSARREDGAKALGSFIRAQRELANLSLRTVAERAGISNPYLSQLERGLHAPSVRVLTSLARTLRIRADVLLEQAGLVDPDDTDADDHATERAIARDPRLTDGQRQALLTVYRSYVANGGAS